MTSFGGLVVFQKLFENLQIWERLHGCFARLDRKHPRFYKHHTIVMCLIVHILLRDFLQSTG